MCEWKRHGDTRIDPCMRNIIRYLKEKGIPTLSSCCGHSKYLPSIVVSVATIGNLDGVIEIFSGKMIPRIKRFYKRDSEGVYYIPEVVKR